MNQYRDLLEKGAAILATLTASLDGDEVRVRIVAVEPLAAAAARAQKGLRIHISDESPLTKIADSLARKGEGEVSVVLKRDVAPEEIEIKLPGGYPVSVDVASALKAIPGVIAVEHV